MGAIRLQHRHWQHGAGLHSSAGQCRAGGNPIRRRGRRVRNLVRAADRVRAVLADARDGAGLVAVPQWRRQLAHTSRRRARFDPGFRPPVRLRDGRAVAAAALAGARRHDRAAIVADPADPGHYRGGHARGGAVFAGDRDRRGDRGAGPQQRQQCRPGHFGGLHHAERRAERRGRSIGSRSFPARSACRRRKSWRF